MSFSSGLAPGQSPVPAKAGTTLRVENTSAQDQRNAFARQLAAHFKMPPLTFEDWSDAFAHLTLQLTDKPTVILFDEISWMGSKDPTFVPKLKNWWDLKLQKYDQVILVFCGSVSTWIEENIINSTAFFGRITLNLELGELSLKESQKFLENRGFKQSLYDTFKLLAVMGGVPWYLEKVLSDETTDENIRRLCFEKNGLLVDEFNHIFYDLFLSKGEIHKKIIQTLGEGMKNYAGIQEALHYTSSGGLSRYIQDLVISGYASAHYAWSLKTGKIGKKTVYRLSDNYLRFYLKYIEPNLLKIEKGSFHDLSLNSLKNWETIMGFQMENLLLNNRDVLIKSMGLNPQEIVADNPYIQKPTARHKGCQIDYLIQTHTNNLFVCEFKFRKGMIGTEVIDEAKEKVKRLVIPRHFAVSTVLFHYGDVSESVYDQGYFYRIVDMADFLDENLVVRKSE